MLEFLKKTSEVKENFWALLIEPEWITSAIWQITDHKVEVISTSPATRWEGNLIEPIDASLSSCTQNLSDDIPDPSKTVFGVPNAWIDNGNIKEEYLEKLKKICQDLSLVPSGFVVLSEAISHFVKQNEEVPLSGIVIGISANALDISIFNSGKLVGTTTVLRSISVEEDLTEGLSRLGGELENFPSRIILFNQKEQELEEIKNALNDSDWNKLGASKFIHPPKIEIMEPWKKIFAVALAGGSEMGEVSGIFEKEHEIDTEASDIPLEEVSNIETPDDVTAEDLGFVTNKQTVSRFLKLPKFNIKKPKIDFKVIGGRPLLIVMVALLTLFSIGFCLWWFLPKATVTIFVEPKKLEENILLNLDDGIKSQEIGIDVSGEKTISTTGTKTIGDKAKGQVKIQNGTGESINLKSGTILISSSDLKFQTIKSASISAALSPTEPGIVTIDVEANNIGSEFNLIKDEKFKVSNYPRADVEAISINSFTGGSSKQISAVSEDDKKRVLKELSDELLKEAKQKLSEKTPDNMLLIESFLDQQIEEENYSNKTGDEATNIKLTLSLKIKASVISKQELSSLSAKAVEGKVPSGFVFRDDQVSYDFGSPKDDKQFDVITSVNLLPSLDTNFISKQIAGKYPHLAETFLASIPGFANAEIRLLPILRGKLGTLPHLSKNIEVIISAEK